MLLSFPDFPEKKPSHELNKKIGCAQTPVLWFSNVISSPEITLWSKWLNLQKNARIRGTFHYLSTGTSRRKMSENICASKWTERWYKFMHQISNAIFFFKENTTSNSQRPYCRKVASWIRWSSTELIHHHFVFFSISDLSSIPSYLHTYRLISLPAP